MFLIDYDITIFFEKNEYFVKIFIDISIFMW